MQTVELVEAQSKLRELVESLALGDEIVIEKNHKPVARLLSTGTQLPNRPPRPLKEFAGKFSPLPKVQQDDLKFHDQVWCDPNA